jgi:putative hydrolase of HD superfamily
MTALPVDGVAAPVQRQLDAYNARDIEAFMRWWAPDCEYFGFPGTLLARGKEAIRDRHVERFREPDLFGRLDSRMVVGNLVVDRETVTRNFPEGLGEIDVLAIYEVADGLIARAWFSMGPRRLHAGAVGATHG